MAPEDSPKKPLCDASQLAELAPVSIMCFNCQGEITFVNDWHLHNFARDRRTREDYLGKSVFDLPGIVSSGLSGLVEEVFTGHTVQVENIFTSEFSGGQTGYQSMRAIPVMKEGRFIGGHRHPRGCHQVCALRKTRGGFRAQDEGVAERQPRRGHSG